ncbi:MAG: glycosyltransferase family 2 protein [Friedmanniella sp.]|nr:glycosyltransferase family 2 protein [Friedmanniella sp.]
MSSTRGPAPTLESASAPRFSVVVPAFNEAAALPATLESLAAQDFVGAYEVLVVDNGSTDETAAVARAYGVRVVSQTRPGVCAARQAGTAVARGEFVVSTDADTVHPVGWLTRVDEQLRRRPDAVAVAGPCRYAHPPWWAAVFPPLWFATVAGLDRVLGRPFYVTATNLAFRRVGFPGYDVGLTQGGDEGHLLRRLLPLGRVVWDRGNPVTTSSRRMDQGLAHTVLVSYGYHYLLADLLNRRAPRSMPRVAPAIRDADRPRVRRRRRRWRLGLGAAVLLLGGLALRRRW